jgi:hypothetical protein
LESQAWATARAAEQSSPVYLKSWKASGIAQGADPPVPEGVSLGLGFCLPAPVGVVEVVSSGEVMVGTSTAVAVAVVSWPLSSEPQPARSPSSAVAARAPSECAERVRIMSAGVLPSLEEFELEVI